MVTLVLSLMMTTSLAKATGEALSSSFARQSLIGNPGDPLIGFPIILDRNRVHKASSYPLAAA
jgi:hypothetical protein